MPAYLTIIDTDGTTRVVHYTAEQLASLYRPEAQSLGDVVADLQKLPKAYDALKLEVCNLTARLEGFRQQSHCDVRDKLLEIWKEFNPVAVAPSDDPVALYRHALTNLKVAKEEASTMEHRLDAIEAILDGCEADDRAHGTSLEDRVTHVCDRADQAEEYEQKESELSDAMEEILDIARRVSSR